MKKEKKILRAWIKFPNIWETHVKRAFWETWWELFWHNSWLFFFFTSFTCFCLTTSKNGHFRLILRQYETFMEILENSKHRRSSERIVSYDLRTSIIRDGLTQRCYYIYGSQLDASLTERSLSLSPPSPFIFLALSRSHVLLIIPSFFRILIYIYFFNSVPRRGLCARKFLNFITLVRAVSNNRSIESFRCCSWPRTRFLDFHTFLFLSQETRVDRSHKPDDTMRYDDDQNVTKNGFLFFKGIEK